MAGGRCQQIGACHGSVGDDRHGEMDPPSDGPCRPRPGSHVQCLMTGHGTWGWGKRADRQAPGNVLAGTPASSLQTPRGRVWRVRRGRRREPWVWSARHAASSRVGNEKDRARAVLLVFVPPPRLPCLAASARWGLAGRPRIFVQGSGRGVSRAPNTDSGITSGARQGVKGDPRGPFTSASCASPCPAAHRG